MKENIEKRFYLLGKLYIALGVASTFAACVCTVAILIDISRSKIPKVAVIILASVGFLSFVFGIAISALFFYGGHSLLKRKRSKFIRLMAYVSCLFIPLNSTLGI